MTSVDRSIEPTLKCGECDVVFGRDVVATFKITDEATGISVGTCHNHLAPNFKRLKKELINL